MLVDAALWTSAAVVAVLALVLSLSSAPTPLRFTLGDKLQHLVGYGALCALVLLAGVWRPRRGMGPWAGRGIAAATAVVAYGWLIEFLQLAVHRDVDIFDALADVLGVLIGFVVWKLAARLIQEIR